MTKHPDFKFERGLCLIRRFPGLLWGAQRAVHVYLIVGRLETGQVFLLRYQGSGLTTWQCDCVLSESMRRKILDRLRKQVRYANPWPGYVSLHDLTVEDTANFEQGQAHASELEHAFIHEALGEQAPPVV